MALELRPLGVACNISCQYCYQNPLREAQNVSAKYDLEAMKAAVLKTGEPFILFGGEPLLMPLKDLEHLFAWGLERFGRNGLQSNGVLITDAHIDLFRRFKVGVGISVDGPDELNDVRWAGTLQRTREFTLKSNQAIQRLLENGICPTLIVTLHKANASLERLPRLKEWLVSLDKLGVRSARLHILEVDSEIVRARWAMSAAENIHAVTEMAELQNELKGLRFDIVDELEQLLLGNDETASCVWRGCDPFTTLAARGIEGNGQMSNCSRTNKSGVNFVRADSPSYERYIALYHTPHRYGGCQGCRFFLQCKGQCPGTAISGDWRNRTEHCEVWMKLFESTEARLLAHGLTPLSVHPERARVENAMLGAWSVGLNPTVRSCITNSACEDHSGQLQ